MKPLLLLTALASGSMPLCANICLPQDKQPAPLLAPNAALPVSPDAQDPFILTEQVSTELHIMAVILSQVQDRESADKAAEQLRPHMAELHSLAFKGDDDSSEGTLMMALRPLVRRGGQREYGELMDQVRRLSLQNYYGSVALRVALYEFY